MKLSQRNFRILITIVAVPAAVALPGWLAQTPLQPFAGFVLLPSLILLTLAVFSWVDNRLAPRESSPLDLACGDTVTLGGPPQVTARDHRPAA